MPYNYPTSIRLQKELKDFLCRRADEDNRKLSQMIILILEQWRAAFLARNKKKTEI